MISFRRLIGQIVTYVGGASRWAVGTLWRRALNKRRFTFREYIHGVENSTDHFSGLDHGMANYLIGWTVIIFLFWLVGAINEFI
nr:hypothetical protein [Allomuricauda sp.]